MCCSGVALGALAEARALIFLHFTARLLHEVKPHTLDFIGYVSLSVNVGYNTATISKANYKAFAVHFSDVANPNEGISISNLVTVAPLASAVNWNATMDQIWRWDTTNNEWARYGYQKPRTGGTAAWRKYDGSAFADLTSADVVLPGETFLYYRGGTATATFTLSGAVKEFTASPSYTISKANYQFVARPWPIGFKLSEINEIATWSALASAINWNATMDQIWRWDTANNEWARYGYQKPRNGGTAAWRKYNGSTFEELTDDDAIGSDEGFLYYRGGTATLTLTFKALQPAE